MCEKVWYGLGSKFNSIVAWLQSLRELFKNSVCPCWKHGTPPRIPGGFKGIGRLLIAFYVQVPLWKISACKCHEVPRGSPGVVGYPGLLQNQGNVLDISPGPWVQSSHSSMTKSRESIQSLMLELLQSLYSILAKSIAWRYFKVLLKVFRTVVSEQTDYKSFFSN